MDDYAPSVTNDPNGFSAWFMSRAGVAIDAYVDRAIRQPQTLTDNGQQWGVDNNGNMYVIGKTNNQVVSHVSTAGQINPMLLIGAAVLLVVMLGNK